jgi:hypothetical protein
MTEHSKQLVWFITGASTGLGRELAEQTLGTDFPDESASETDPSSREVLAAK